MMEEKLRFKILIVDDEINILKTLKFGLKSIEEAEILEATTGFQALMLIEENNIDIVITDLKMPGIDGIELLRKIKEKDERVSVILITGYGTIQTAVEAIKKGAEDYITKPFKVDELVMKVRKILEKKHLDFARIYNKNGKDLEYGVDIIGNSRHIKSVRNLINEIAKYDSAVLITGETGTGKGLVARAIHLKSHRANKPFVVLNCGFLPEGLLESELFGHEAGSFTGAISTRKGRFEIANGGTIFIDEIAEINLNTQIKLLRVLEDKEFERIGGERTIKVDVRIISATNKDINKQIEQGKFREDLFYRINVMNIHLLPLRERREDILPLAFYFLNKFSYLCNKLINNFSEEALELLENYEWKGNVRELENAIERAVIICEGKIIQPYHLPECLWSFKKQINSIKLTTGITLKDAEKEIILKTLELTNGNKTKAAKILGISSRKIEYLVKKWRS